MRTSETTFKEINDGKVIMITEQEIARSLMVLQEQAGSIAFELGESIESCPYLERTPDAENWKRGYINARLKGCPDAYDWEYFMETD